MENTDSKPMGRTEQLTRELYIVHKSGEHSVAYAVARIVALENLLRRVLDEDEYEFLSDPLRDGIQDLVPDEDTFSEEEDDTPGKV